MKSLYTSRTRENTQTSDRTVNSERNISRSKDQSHHENQNNHNLNNIVNISTNMTNNHPNSKKYLDSHHHDDHTLHGDASDANNQGITPINRHKHHHHIDKGNHHNHHHHHHHEQNDDHEERELLGDGMSENDFSYLRPIRKKREKEEREHLKNTIKLCIMIAMVVAFFFAELIVGYAANSLSLLSDAFHMLSDGISLVIGLIALRLSKRAAGKVLSYGWGRTEILGGLVNGVFLLSVVMFIYLEAIQRLFEPKPVENPILVLIVGGMGLLINVIGMIMFGHHHHPGHEHHHDHHHEEGMDETNHKHDDEESHDHHHHEDHHDEHNNHDHSHHHGHSHANLNLTGVFLHILGDFLGSIGVIISSLVIYFFDPKTHPWSLYVDPVISAILATIILASTIPLVKNCSKILLQSVPDHIDVETLKAQLLKLNGVIDVHELHVWKLVNTKVICSVHVTCLKSEDFMDLALKIQSIFHQNGIHNSTIQPEFVYSVTDYNKSLIGCTCADDTDEEATQESTDSTGNGNTAVIDIEPSSTSEKSNGKKKKKKHSANCAPKTPCQLTCDPTCQDDWCCPPPLNPKQPPSIELPPISSIPKPELREESNQIADPNIKISSTEAATNIDNGKTPPTSSDITDNHK